ncbi:MAG: hypothetical protein H6706_26920 [Myxococcales bacterium]|nr:hypothetical protein [Myxococcales bacterium]
MGEPTWFIGLAVPAGDWFRRLVDPPPGLRLEHPDDLHLTLAFLGPAGAERARAAWAACEALGGPVSARGIALRPFGRPGAWSALALALDAAAAVTLGERIRPTALAAAGRPPEDRALRPHVTVGRVNQPRHHAEVLAWANEISLQDVRLQLDRVVLYTAGGGGRKYREVEWAPLQG